MKTLISLLFALLFLNSCNPINKDVERYNEAIHKELGETISTSIYYTKGDTVVWASGLHKGKDGWGGYYEEYPPGPSYYMIRKNFYPNGVLESKGMRAGGYTKIGIWYYYDDCGNLTLEVDEDAKFGKIKLDWIIEFLKKEGYEDWKRNFPQTLELSFAPKGEELDYPVWFVSVYKYAMINYYRIQGDTGEVLEKGIKENPSYKD